MVILKSPRKRLGANEADNTVRLYRDFVTDADRALFLEHIRCCHSKFSADYIGPLSDPSRQSYRIDQTEDFTPLHQRYLNKIQDTLGIHNAKIDFRLGIQYRITNPGGFIQRHVDLYPFRRAIRFVHYRFNIILNRDDSESYNPIICDKSYDVPLNGAWSFAASLLPHETKVVQGKGQRIVLEYGWMLPMRDYFKLVL